MESAETSSCLIDFDDIVTPKIFAIVSGVGSGSKLLQSFLDNHEQIFMIPAYPLLYFYPHWLTWEKEFKNQWNWETLIDVFCSKHASVLDSRRIPGHNGLTTLGINQNEHVEIDENLFRLHLAHLLKNQKIHRKTFLLAVHYAYALCKNEDISKKKILVYHIHDQDYLVQYLAKDFPDVKTIVLLRDQRSSVEHRVKAHWNVDDAKMNRTDALVYKQKAYCHIFTILFNELNKLRELPLDNIRAIRHEDLTKAEEIMPLVADFLGIEYLPSMLEITFDGKAWWGDKIYNMKPMNIVNPRVLSQEWQKTFGEIDWFVMEGLLFDYFKKYDYPVYKYTQDSLLSKILLFFSILIPSQIERRVFIWYLNPINHIQLIKAAIGECTEKVTLKDYTWNATYLYKRNFLEFQLWRQRWYRSFLQHGRKIAEKEYPSWIKHGILFLSRAVYVLATYGRFWLAILSYPLTIAKRWKHALSCYSRRIGKSNRLPHWINVRTS